MGYLQFVVVLFLFAETWSVEQLVADCELPGGNILKDGEKTGDPCDQCHCVKGDLQCMSAFCEEPSCADPIPVPGQCCPICPNVLECSLPGGGTLIPGSQTITTDGQVCSCPSSITGQQVADCRLHQPDRQDPQHHHQIVTLLVKWFISIWGK